MTYREPSIEIIYMNEADVITDSTLEIGSDTPDASDWNNLFGK